MVRLLLTLQGLCLPLRHRPTTVTGLHSVGSIPFLYPGPVCTRWLPWMAHVPFLKSGVLTTSWGPPVLRGVSADIAHCQSTFSQHFEPAIPQPPIHSAHERLSPSPLDCELNQDSRLSVPNFHQSWLFPFSLILLNSSRKCRGFLGSCPLLCPLTWSAQGLKSHLCTNGSLNSLVFQPCIPYTTVSP